MKPEWKDLRSGPSIDLTHIDLYTFQIYVHWLYFRTLPIDGKGKAAHPILAKVYVLGEELMDSKFKNDVLDTIIATATEARSFPVGKAVAIIYQGTTSSSPARRLIVDFYTGLANNKTWTDGLKDCPKDFLVDAMKALVTRRARDEKRPWVEDFRLYHESEEEHTA